MLQPDANQDAERNISKTLFTQAGINDVQWHAKKR